MYVYIYAHIRISKYIHTHTRTHTHTHIFGFSLPIIFPFCAVAEKLTLYAKGKMIFEPQSLLLKDGRTFGNSEQD